jgi:preprotein translocase subunit SecE
MDGVKLMKESSAKLKEFFNKLGNKFRDALDFIKDTRKELNNVSWPSRSEVTGTTFVVIAAVFFFGVFLYVVDLIVSNGMNYILNMK